jgi:3-hydroxy-3-methylglutaryl CoA synthase
MTTAPGLVAVGAYIPRRRLQRKVIAETHGWFAPGLAGLAKGERAMANWDEDAVTMAVEAARDALRGRERTQLSALRFASTTGPFVDRLHAGVVAEALDLGPDLHTSDVATTQRAGTSALLDALSAPGETLVVAAENRRTKAASPLELASGDGAAAIVTGTTGVIARLLGRAAASADFVDHFRSMENTFDYTWEERWVRDAGYLQIVPPVVARCLAAAKVAPADVTVLCVPSTIGKIGQALAKACRIPETATADTLAAVCGDTGVAQPLVMLVAALEKAKPGDKILVVGFGQGADALLFEATAEIANRPAGGGVAGHLARRRPETSYGRFLAFNDLIEMERGMRAETDKATPLSSLWRNRKTVTSFIGGKCATCGTVQFPKTNVCVNPNCNAFHTQEDHPFAEKTGTIMSFTADRLTYSPDPPAMYGMIQFAEGGRAMLDFTDIDEAGLSVDAPMRMMFRIKDIDTARGFRRYFWKAAPA